MSPAELSLVRLQRAHDFYDFPRPRWPVSKGWQRAGTADELRDRIRGGRRRLYDDRGGIAVGEARSLIEFSMVWVRGGDEEVAAPGHSRNIVSDAGAHSIRLGRDTLDITTAVGRCLHQLNQWSVEERNPFSAAAIGSLHSHLAGALRTAVRNYKGQEYNAFGKDEAFRCGTTKLVVPAFTDHVLLRLDLFPLLTRVYRQACPGCARAIAVDQREEHRSRCR